MAAGLQSERSVCAKGSPGRSAPMQAGVGGSSGQFHGRRGGWLLGGCVLVVLACIWASSASAATTLHVDVVHGTDSGGCQSAPCWTLGRYSFRF